MALMSQPAESDARACVGPRRRAGGLLPAHPTFIAATASATSLQYASSVAPTEASKTAPIHPLPPHWDSPQHPIPRLLFDLLCLTAMGSTHLYELWWDTHSQATMNEGLAKIRERITTVTIVAGLILASTAALLTTTPPRVDIVNYNARGAYILILFSLAISLGGLIAGSMCVYVLSGTIEKDWFRSALMSKRSKVVIWLAQIGYPFFSIAVSTMMTAIGLIIAAFDSSDLLVQICSAFALALPIIMALGGAYIARDPGAREIEIRRWKHRIERTSSGRAFHVHEEGVEVRAHVQALGANDTNIVEEKMESGVIVESVSHMVGDERYARSGTYGRVSFEVSGRGGGVEV